MYENSQIGLLYLGSSGAGVKFTELLSEELPKYGKDVTLFTRKRKFQRRNNLQVFLVKLPSSRVLAAIGIGRDRAMWQIIQQIRKDKIRIVIIPMAHPWD